MSRRDGYTTRRRAFTLVEVMIVIGVILLLLTLSIGGGRAVIRGQKANVTKSILNTLDRALEEYITVNNGVIPAYTDEAYDEVPGPELAPGISNMYTTSDTVAFTQFPSSGRPYPRFPDASVFLRQAKGTGVVDQIIAALPESHLKITRGELNQNDGDQDTTPSIIDSWGEKDWSPPWYTLRQQMILYVHPSNRLAQALYGRCINDRPYFLSAGPDRLYGNGIEFPESATKEDVEGALNDNLMSAPVAPLDTANLTGEFFSDYRNVRE